MSRLIAIICTGLILFFSLIHLAVSISILARFSRYGDVFRPEIGLGSFNLIIAVIGLIIGGFGLFSVLTYRRNLSEYFTVLSTSMIAAYACAILALFTIASLITALVINSLAVNYVYNRFTDHINNYLTSRNSRNIVDKIQTHYVCCGSSTWTEWSSVAFNVTTTTTTVSVTTNTPIAEETTTVIAGETTTVIAGETTTVIAGETTSIIAEEITTALAVEGTTVVAEETTAIVKSNVRRRNIQVKKYAGTQLMMDNSYADILSSKVFPSGINYRQDFFQQAPRRKRQLNTNRAIIYDVTLPRSCCTTDLSSVGNPNNLYCFSNSNSSSDAIHTVGCGQKLSKPAVGQTIGLAVINSFLFLVLLASVAVLLQFAGDDPQSNTTYGYSQTYGFQNEYQPYSNNNVYNMPAYDQAAIYNSFNPTYGYGQYDHMNAYSNYYYPTYMYNNHYPGYGYSSYNSAYGYGY